MKLLYLRPSFGGIHDYGRSILRILKASVPGADIVAETIGWGHFELLPGLWRGLGWSLRRRDAVYVELGWLDLRMFWGVWMVTKLRPRTRLLITIHDSHDVVRGPFAFKLLARLPRPVSSIVNRGTWALNRALGRRLVRGVLRSADTIFCMNPSTDQIEGRPARYLPFPVYHAERPVAASRVPAVPRVGYTGYWDEAKGVGTLVEAIRLLKQRGVSAEYIVSGAGTRPDDPYVARMRRELQAIDAGVRTPGFIADDELDAFIASLDLLVIPYWRAVPGSASAAAARGMEMGVPVVASRTHALVSQLGEKGAFYAEPENPASLASAIEQALVDRGSARRIAEQNQTRVFEQNSWERVGTILRSALAPSADH
jgi:glycosyltransferase involved in cell wall biosynthesis